ncbi:MAG: lytic transglycosylase domain-containing protein, partial [Candidatus Caldatribacteriota bacterium]|nr:lytic transglycosylase domain-containing protein [Atribacterota bacterium]
ILEISYALKQEPNNIYLQFLLTKAYAEAEEYYRSLSHAQILLNYFLINNKEQIPLVIWEYAFPTYYYSLVKKIAADYSLDPYLIWATIREESHFNPYSESKAGARGLMQIMFSTGDWIAQKLNYQEFEYDLLFNPEVNIKFGGWYLQYLQERFDKNTYLIVSGYNAGPGITDRWLENMDIKDLDIFVENIPYAETSEHIKKVMRSYLIYQIIYKN